MVHRRLAVEGLRHERLLLAGGGILLGPVIAAHLAGASEVIVAVCTVGDRISSAVSEQYRSDPVWALALEGVAGAAAEALAEAACRHFDALALAEGRQTSISLNPGMIGWPLVEGQSQVFGLLDASEIGVFLGAGSIMQPLKSLSLVIGMGPSLSNAGRACDFCSMSETCRYKDHDGGSDKTNDIPG